jgi:hypothetical protein
MDVSRCSVDRRPATAGKTMKLGQALPNEQPGLAHFARVNGRLGNWLAALGGRIFGVEMSCE